MGAKLIRESLVKTNNIPSNLWRGDWQEMKLTPTTTFHYEIRAVDQLHISHFCKLGFISFRSCPVQPWLCPTDPNCEILTLRILKSIYPCAANVSQKSSMPPRTETAIPLMTTAPAPPPLWLLAGLHLGIPRWDTATGDSEPPGIKSVDSPAFKEQRFYLKCPQGRQGCSPPCLQVIPRPPTKCFESQTSFFFFLYYSWVAVSRAVSVEYNGGWGEIGKTLWLLEFVNYIFM